MTPKERAAMQQALEALHNTQNALLFVSGSIEQFIISNMTADAHDDADKAITALREALDHSGEANEMVVGWDMVKPEAIASDPLYQQGFVDGVEEGRNQVAEQAEQSSEAATPTTLAEPVARVSGYYGGRCVIEPLNRATVLPTDMALYAAPVQQVTRADLKAAFKEGFERAADLYAPKDVQEQAEQEPFAYEVWDENDQVLILIYASCLKEFHWIEQDDIARVLYAAPVRTKDLTDDELNEMWYGNTKDG